MTVWIDVTFPIKRIEVECIKQDSNKLFSMERYLQISTNHYINNRQLSIFFLNSSFPRKKFACQTSEVGEGGASSGCGAPRPRRRRGGSPLGGVQEAQGHRAQRRDVPHGATEQLGHAKKPRGKHADWQIVNKQNKM